MTFKKWSFRVDITVLIFIGALFTLQNFSYCWSLYDGAVILEKVVLIPGRLASTFGATCFFFSNKYFGKKSEKRIIKVSVHRKNVSRNSDDALMSLSVIYGISSLTFILSKESQRKHQLRVEEEVLGWLSHRFTRDLDTSYRHVWNVAFKMPVGVYFVIYWMFTSLQFDFFQSV